MKIICATCEICGGRPTMKEATKIVKKVLDTCAYCGELITADRVVVSHRIVDGKHSKTADVVEASSSKVVEVTFGYRKGKRPSEKRAFLHSTCLPPALPHLQRSTTVMYPVQIADV